jgi:hypothetical protein
MKILRITIVLFAGLVLVNLDAVGEESVLRIETSTNLSGSYTPRLRIGPRAVEIVAYVPPIFNATPSSLPLDFSKCTFKVYTKEEIDSKLSQVADLKKQVETLQYDISMLSDMNDLLKKRLDELEKRFQAETNLGGAFLSGQQP